MSLRRKYAAIFVSSLALAVATILVMSHVDLHGYALLPFVVVAGVCLYVAWASFFGIFVPRHNMVEDSLSFLLMDLLFGFLKR